MVINLNKAPEIFKEFYGRYCEQMPKLRAEGREPLTMAQIAEQRLRQGGDWLENYFDTCDSIVRKGDKIKVTLSCPYLIGINPKTKLKNYGVGLLPSQYEKLRGKTFEVGELILSRDLTKEEALEHPVWQYLLGAQLKPYVDLVFAEYEKAMGIWITDYELSLRAWFVNGLGGRSQAAGDDLDGRGGRLVGVAQDARRKKK